jgi:hypothetical protein
MTSSNPITQLQKITKRLKTQEDIDNFNIIFDNQFQRLEKKKWLDGYSFVYIKNSDYKVGWMLDSEASCCMSCRNKFNLLFRRKHHCRSCGIIICIDCSIFSTTNIDGLSDYEPNGSRICRHFCAAAAQHKKELNKLQKLESSSSSFSVKMETSKRKFVGVCQESVRKLLLRMKHQLRLMIHSEMEKVS